MTPRIINLGGGTAYEYIGEDQQEYEALLAFVKDSQQNGDVERDCVPIFNRRPTLWACNPYTGQRCPTKEVRIVIVEEQGMEMYDILPNHKLKEWTRPFVKEVIQ